MTKLFIAATAAILLLMGAANAQVPPCVPYADLLAMGAKEYDEHPAIEFEMVDDPTVRVVVLISPTKHTATLITVHPGAAGVEMACVRVTGENARKPLPAKLPGRGA